MSNKTKNKPSKTTDLASKRKKLALSLRLNRLARASGLLFLLLILLTGLFEQQTKWLKEQAVILASKAGFNLTDIIIEGAGHLTQKEVFKLAKIPEQAGILALDLDLIRTNIESNSWVKHALVERKLPNRLYIGIVEKQPVALWQYQQKLCLIDKSGTKITSKNISAYPGLLQVVGSGANIHATMLIELIGKHSELAKRIYAAVRISDRRWNLYLEQDILVKMPAKNFSIAYDRLVKMHNKGQLFGKDIEYIDLRNPKKTYTKYL